MVQLVQTQQRQSFMGQAPFLAHLRDLQIGLTADEMRTVVQAAAFAISNLYVHLPQKSSAFGTDIPRELAVLEDTVPYVRTEREFTTLLQRAMKRLFDRHTCLVNMSPWKTMVAFLPVMLEACWAGNRRKVIVSRIFDASAAGGLKVGVEITHWAGIPIANYVEQLSWATDGANPPARVALALRSLTVRPLGFFLPPDEDWVTLSTWDGHVSAAVALSWRVYDSSQFASHQARSNDVPGGYAISLGLDRSTSLVNSGLRELFSAATPAKSPQLFLTARQSHPIANPLADNLTFDVVELGNEIIGYIRIFSFEAPDSASFFLNFARICALLPEKIILDVRGNPGGTIPSGEMILQLFSAEDIEFGKLEFRNTKLAKTIVDGIDYFAEWRPSMRLAVDTGQDFSQAIPITKKEQIPAFSFNKPKKAALIIDALCYSTTDFFSAGFRDNKLGPIIGVDRVTGAGGANVWSYSQVVEFAQQAGSNSLIMLPRDFDFNLSVRRAIRAGELRGMPLEGLGAAADVDHIYLMTDADVLGNNEGLITYAASVLSAAS